jgi:hypothetical protein
MALTGTEIVEKRNVLNEIRPHNMSLQEMRFFGIYLSKINMRNRSTRVVKFSLSEFQRIMEIGRVKANHIKPVIRMLLQRTVDVELKTGEGYEIFHLFKKGRVFKESDGEWHVEIDAHDDALPLMFEFKDRYFKYAIRHALRLKSVNQYRMYEVLKQYEFLGERIISVTELRNLLEIEKDEYPRWGNFKTRVLDACQSALEKYTDIKFTYEPHGRRGPGGKIMALKFTIEKNDDFVDQLSFDDFLPKQQKEAYTDEIDVDAIDVDFTVTIDDNDEKDDSLYRKRINLFTETALDNEFTKEEVELINSIIADIYPEELEACNFLIKKYKELNVAAKKTDIASRFGYFKSMIESDTAKQRT